ncbi:MAG: AAA family ATPase [Hormoscilla sp.]
MITAIAIEGFKTLAKVSLTLGNLNFLSGTNASGKSNFFDGLRVLQGIGYGLTIDEIFNGKPKRVHNIIATTKAPAIVHSQLQGDLPKTANAHNIESRDVLVTVNIANNCEAVI